MVWSDLINSSTDCNTINTWFTLCIIRKHVTIAILALISQDASPQMENSWLSKEYFVSQGKLKTIYDQNILQAENNLCKKENQRLSKIREFCLRYFQICPVDSQPSLVSPWRAVVNANFRISHEAKISNELSFMDFSLPGTSSSFQQRRQICEAHYGPKFSWLPITTVWIIELQLSQSMEW